MSEEEYNEQLAKLKQELKRREEVLAKTYAYANNPVFIGDIVTDHVTTIKVQKIGIYRSLYPSCFYIGVELKKDLTPKKRQENTTIYQCNIVKIDKGN